MVACKQSCKVTKTGHQKAGWLSSGAVITIVDPWHRVVY